jgi:hypothetical protein
MISKFARATTVAASAIAKVASIFGYTNVPVIADVSGFVPLPYSMMSTSEISAPVQKLTLDPKQELSIDPTLLNIGSTDEMCIKHIISKPTLLNNFAWSSAAFKGDVLANFRISPMLFQSYRVPKFETFSSIAVWHTWLSYLGMLFSHWRGDIIFDIHVVCTKFHKGRLQISWDPCGSSGATQYSENAVTTTILDIGENNRVSLSVPFHSAHEWLTCRGISEVNWSVNSANAANLLLDNGMLIISVLNPLVSPIDPQTLSILVSVRGGENFEFANPRSSLAETEFSSPPTVFTVQSEDRVDMSISTLPFGDAGSKHPNRYDLNFGERIVSLRALLRRYSLYDYDLNNYETTVNRTLRLGKSYPLFPPMFGYDPEGTEYAQSVFNPVLLKPCNFRPTHPITYVGLMYGGLRGGVNYIINATDGRSGNITEARVQRVTSTNLGDYRSITTVSSTLMTDDRNIVKFANSLTLPQYSGGGTIANADVNGTFSVYYPQMTQASMYYPDPYHFKTGNSYDFTSRTSLFLDVILKQGTANVAGPKGSFGVTTYMAIGTDFSANWLLCCPTLIYYLDMPVASPPP